MFKDVCAFPGGIFTLKIYRNSREAGTDILSRIKKFFGFNVVLGTPIDEVTVHNKMTNASLAVISGLIGNTGAQTAFGYLALGTSTTAVSAAHTGLQAELSTLGLSRTSSTQARTTTAQTNDTVTFSASWNVTGSTTIEEVGIFNAASSGTMLARALTTSKAVINGNVVTVTYSFQVVGN